VSFDFRNQDKIGHRIPV